MAEPNGKDAPQKGVEDARSKEASRKAFLSALHNATVLEAFPETFAEKETLVQVGPTSLGEAVEAIRAEFPEAELRAWASQTEGSAEVQAHFGLGLWIRNQWFHGAGSPLAAQIQRAAHCEMHPDDVSSIIVRALWRVLNGQPCPTIEQLHSGDFSERG
jgi:hypothetical protein